MSRLRRLVLSDRLISVTCRLRRDRGPLTEREFACLARVIEERRKKHGFLLTASFFLPDHWHGILFPRYPLMISRVMESAKVGSTLRTWLRRQVNAARGEAGALWQGPVPSGIGQGRFFDRAVRTVKEYRDKVEYIHQNPVKSGLVSRAEDWRWSSVHDYTGSLKAVARIVDILPIDRVLLPADEWTRI